MDKKEKSIILVTALIVFVINLFVAFIFFDLNLLRVIFMLFKNFLLSLYVSMSVFATYCLIKDKATRATQGAILITILLILFDLAWMTYFEFKVINNTFILVFMILIFAIVKRFRQNK